MSKQCNILHLVLDADIGGLQFVVFNLLKSIDRAKYRPFLGCLLNTKPLESAFKGIDVQFISLNKPANLDVFLPFKLAKILKEKDISLIHTHNTGPYLYGAIAARLAGVPVIIHTEHGRTFPDKKRLMRAEKILSIFTNQIISVSNILKQNLMRYENISSNKIRVVHNGIDVDRFCRRPSHEAKAIKKELGFEPDDFIIGNVARLDTVKDHENLIKAYAVVQEKVPQAKLLIIGEGPLKNEIVKLVNELEISQNVTFLSARKDIPELLNVIDIFVLSSRNEGISLTLLEAMASERAVIATEVGGNKEIIQHRLNGFLVPPSDFIKLSGAILELLNNKDLAMNLAIEARKTILMKFSVSAMTRQYEEVYAKYLKQNG